MNFTGKEYLKIDIANCYGLDKKTWEQRLDWFDFNEHRLEELLEEADTPYLMLKAVLAYRNIDKASGHNMFLDATASGIQVMACLSGCTTTAEAVNLIYTHKRRDVYEELTQLMNTKLDSSEQVTRAEIKKPLMTHFYSKTSQESLSEAQEEVFYECVHNMLPGASEVMTELTSCWDAYSLKHSWKLPDGHIVNALVQEITTKRIEIDELDHTTFAYRFKNNEPSRRSSSLCANVIHSIDGYIAREMVRGAYNMGFQLAHIHDA